jgi:phosphonate transport system permease protein
MEADIFRKRRTGTLIFFGLIALLAAGSIIITQFNIQKGFTSFFKAFKWGASNFYPDAKSMSNLPDIIIKLKDTVLISIASTTVAAVFSLLLAFMGSRATRINNLFTIIARGIASLFRNIPLVAWAMVLMLAFSQSSLTGFLALFLGSIGFLTRSFMEAIDEVSDSTIEALRATGASDFHIVFQAILPTSLPQIVSWLLFMIETNIRDATLVGLLTGTGIGFAFDVYYKAFNYHAASLVVVVTVITVIITERISNFVRGVIL